MCIEQLEIESCSETDVRSLPSQNSKSEITVIPALCSTDESSFLNADCSLEQRERNTVLFVLFDIFCVKFKYNNNEKKANY